MDRSLMQTINTMHSIYNLFLKLLCSIDSNWSHTFSLGILTYKSPRDGSITIISYIDRWYNYNMFKVTKRYYEYE